MTPEMDAEEAEVAAGWFATELGMPVLPWIEGPVGFQEMPSVSELSFQQHLFLIDIFIALASFSFPFICSGFQIFIWFCYQGTTGFAYLFHELCFVFHILI